MGEDSGLVGIYQVVPEGTPQVTGDGENYTQAETEWKRLGNVLWGEAAGDEFAFSGMAMSADGTRIAVGAPFRDVPVVTENGTQVVWEDTGNIRVFDYDQKSKTWTQTGASISGRAQGDVFGRGLAMSSAVTFLAQTCRLDLYSLNPCL